MANRSKPATWFFLVSLALSAVVAWEMIIPLSVGATLAYVSERPIEIVEQKLGWKSERARVFLAVMFVLLVTAVLVVPLALALYVALRDLARVVASKDTDEWMRIFTRGIEWSTKYLATHGIDIDPNELPAKARGFMAANAGRIGSWVGDILSTTPNAIFNALATMLAWVYLAIEGKEARNRILVRLMPWEHERETIRKITAEVIQQTIVANLAVSFIQAIAMALVLLILGVPRPFVWGVLTFFLSFVPVVGTAPIVLGAAGYLFMHHRPGAAIAALIFGVLAAGIDNVLRPLFLRGASVELNFLWVLVSLIGGVAMFGLPGVIVGPLAFSLLIASLRSLEALDQSVTAEGTPPET